jgi:hypothetical protein
MRTRIVVSLMLLVAALSGLAGAQVVLTDDTFTWSQTPKANYGNQIALVVCAGTNTYLKFSLASLPSGLNGTNISGASVVLYTDAVLSSGTMDVYAVSGPWSEGSITYNNAPALGNKLLSAVSVTKTGYLSLNLTSTVQAWLNGTSANSGIALVPSSGSQISVSFDSKENILTSHTAELSLVLVSAGVQGPAGAQGLPGATGLQGPIGTTGAIGAVGPAGPQGPQGATGAQGLQGPMGLPGVMGTTGPQGPAGTNGNGFNFRDAFDNSVSYAVNDVATFQGASYVAITANQGPNSPTPDQNLTAWSLMAQAGAVGAQGPQGLSGSIGPQGATGTTGPAGIQGPVGPQGPPGTPPPNVALTNSVNTFAASQTVNGSVILGGLGAGIQFADGTLQMTAAQGRITGSCGDGTSIISINADGSVVCSQPVFSTTGVANFQVVPPLLGSRFGQTAITIGSDGFPVLVFGQQDTVGGNSSVGFIHCGNFACSTGNTSATLFSGFSPGFVGASLSLTVGSDGFPVLSSTATAVNGSSFVSVTHCRNLLCSLANGSPLFLTATDTTAAAITLGPSGNPIVSYRSGSGSGGLGLVFCDSPSCSSAVARFIPGPQGVGSSITMAPSPSNFPIVSSSGGFVSCKDSSCTAFQSRLLADGGLSSLISGSDGLPIMTFAEGDKGLVVLHCSDPTCENSTRTALDSGRVATSPIFFGSKNLPIIAYAVTPSGLGESTIEFIRCGDANCASGNQVSSLVTPFNQGITGLSLVMGADALPIMSYSVGSAVYVTHCNDENCTPPNITRR